MNTPSGIPDPGGASGTFSALERSRPAVEMFTYAGAHHVRVLRDVEGEPWFVLSDLCRVLGIGNVGNVTARLTESGSGIRQADISSGGQLRSMTLVDEPGMYEVVIRSDKPSAVAFRRWITSEVLPAIRKTGTYSRFPAQPTALPSKKELAQWVVEAEERAELAEHRVAELEPSAHAWDELGQLGADFDVADAAKILSRDPSIDIGRNRLFEFMHDQDWIFRGRHNSWKAYQDQVDCGRLKHRPGERYWDREREEYRLGDPTILVTPKGIAELCRRLGGKQLTLVTS